MHNGPKENVATKAGEQGAGVRGVQGGDLLGRAGTRVVLAAVAELRAQLVARAREGEAQLVPAPAAASTRAVAGGGHLTPDRSRHLHLVKGPQSPPQERASCRAMYRSK